MTLMPRRIVDISQDIKTRPHLLAHGTSLTGNREGTPLEWMRTLKTRGDVCPLDWSLLYGCPNSM